MNKLFFGILTLSTLVFAQSSTPLPGQSPTPPLEPQPPALAEPNTRATGTLVTDETTTTSPDASRRKVMKPKRRIISPNTTMPSPTTPNTPRPPGPRE